jgi:transposase-like protein
MTPIAPPMVGGMITSTIHVLILRPSPAGLPGFEKVFSRHKRAVGKSWRMDEPYIKVKRSWK